MAEPGDSAGAPGSAIISLVGGDLHPQHDDGEAARVRAPGPDAPVDFAPDRQPSAGWAWLEERLESAEVQAEGSAQAEAPPAKSANTGQLESPVAELESPMSPERRKLEGYPGHHTHTLNQPRPWSRHRIDRHHEATLPALSPGGTLRSPGGREVTRGQGGRLMSPNGTVRPGVLATPGGAIRPGVLQDNWVEAGWKPMTKADMRKIVDTEAGERGRGEHPWFVDDSDGGQESPGTGAWENRRDHYVLSRRADHQRLSTSHAQVVAAGVTGTRGLDSDWGGVVGGKVTPQAVLRCVTCAIFVVDCVILGNQAASRNPYHPKNYNPKAILGYNRSLEVKVSRWSERANSTQHYLDTVAAFEEGYGWGSPGQLDAYYDTSLVGFLIWDILMSMYLTAEICLRYWPYVSAIFERRREQHAERRALEAQSKINEQEKEGFQRNDVEPNTAAVTEHELELQIAALEDELKEFQHQLDIQKLATRPMNLTQLIIGRSERDRKMLAGIQADVVGHTDKLSATRECLKKMQQDEEDRKRAAFVLTLDEVVLERELQQTSKMLRKAQREEGARNYLVVRRKSQEQQQEVERLQTQVAEVTRNLELLRQLRPKSDNHESVSSATDAGSGFSSSATEVHVAGEESRVAFVQRKRELEHTAMQRWLHRLDLVIAFSSWLHLVLTPLGVPFTLRPVRVMRALHYLSIDFAVLPLRCVMYGLSVSREFVQAALILLLLYAILTSRFLFKIFSLESAHFRCILCQPIAPGSLAINSSSLMDGNHSGSNGSDVIRSALKMRLPGDHEPEIIPQIQQTPCYDAKHRWNSSDSPFPTLLVPEQWCRIQSNGSTCPPPFSCEDVRSFVDYTPFHLDNYLGVASVLYASFALDGYAPELLTQMCRSVSAYLPLFVFLLSTFVFVAGMFGVGVMRAAVAHSLALMWRRITVVDIDSHWFRIEGWAPWERKRLRPSYLPPPVEYGPGLAAGAMSPLSVASSPRRVMARTSREFRNNDAVQIDPFSKVQPQMNLRAFCVHFCESRACEAVSCLFILAHFLLQASWHVGMTVTMESLLTISEAAAYALFVLEMQIKVYAAGGLSNFCSSLWRVLELIVVSTSVAAWAADLCQCPGPSNIFLVGLKQLVHLRFVRILVMESGSKFLCDRCTRSGSAALAVLALSAAALAAGSVLAKVTIGYRVQTWADNDCHAIGGGGGGAIGGGRACVLPFVYKGTEFETCTTVDNNAQLWCATTANFDKDRLWANCTCLLPRHSLANEEASRASFQTVAWSLLTSFRLFSGDAFSDIYIDSLATAEEAGSYTVGIGAGLMSWHVIVYVILQGAFLAYALEFFSFASWQRHWENRRFLAGIIDYFFDVVVGEDGPVQMKLEPIANLISNVFDFFWNHFVACLPGRVHPEEGNVASPPSVLPSLLSYGGEPTPAVQSWWRNTPVMSSSPVKEASDVPTDADVDTGFKKVGAGSNFLRHADHFLNAGDPQLDCAATGEPQSVGAGVKKSRWTKVAFMMKEHTLDATKTSSALTHGMQAPATTDENVLSRTDKPAEDITTRQSDVFGSKAALDRGEQTQPTQTENILGQDKMAGNRGWSTFFKLGAILKFGGFSRISSTSDSALTVLKGDEDSEKFVCREKLDTVASLMERPKTDMSRRTETQASRAESKRSMSVAFSAFSNEKSDKFSTHTDDPSESEYESSDDSPEKQSPESPRRKKIVQIIYIDDIYQDAYLDGRASRASAEVPERARKTDNNLPQRVLFCLSLEHRLRKLAIRLQETQEFNIFVNMVILFNFVVIALSPVGWGSVDNYLRVKRGFFDFVTAVLVLEMLPKICTFGLLMTPTAMLRSPLFVSELLIVCISIGDGGSAGRHVFACCAKSLRLLWLLHSLSEHLSAFPWRRWTRQESLRNLLQGLLHAFHPLMWCLGFWLLGAVMFGMIGVRIAGGRLDSCTDAWLESSSGSKECVSYYVTSTGVMLPRAWHDAPFTFNDLPNALVSLMVVSTMRWSDISHDLMDGTFHNKKYERINRPEMAIFLAAFITFVVLMLGNMGLAYIVNAIRDSENLERKRRRRYINFLNRIHRWEPPPEAPKSVSKGAEFARISLDIPGFKETMELLNFVGIAIMLFEQADMPNDLAAMVDVSRFVLGFFIFLEIFLNTQALGPSFAFRQASTRCNLVILVGVLVWGVGATIHGFLRPVFDGKPWVQSLEFRLVLLICESARIARLILWFHDYSKRTHWISMQIIFRTFRFCIPRIITYLFVAVVVLVMFAAIGMQLFSHVRTGTKLGYLMSLNALQDAFFMLCYILAGGEWQQLMLDCSVSFPACTPSFKDQVGVDTTDMGVGDCGSPALALLYFVGVKFVMTTTFCGCLMWCVLESFHEAWDVEDGRIQNSDLAALGLVWQQDPSISGKHLLISHVTSILRKLSMPLRLLSEERETHLHEAGDEQAFDNHPTVDRVLIELSILAWCRRMQRLREDDAGKVSACSITGYPDIRSVPIYDIRTDEKIDWFDFVVTLMHTVTPEVQSEDVLVLRRPILVIVEKVIAAKKISSWLRRLIRFRDGWNALLDKVHEAVRHLREQEAAEKKRLMREKMKAAAEESRRLKRMMDEIYNVEAWVMKTCPLWEQAELERRKREEEEEERLRIQAIQEAGGWIGPEAWNRIPSDTSAESDFTVSRVVSDAPQSEFAAPAENLKMSGLLKKFQTKAKTSIFISRLSKGDGRTDSYFARSIYYQIMLPYGVQSGSPISPSTSEHIQGHPFWKDSPSSFRTIAIPMSPYDHPLSASMRPKVTEKEKKKKRKNLKGRSRFGHGAYTANELCAVINALIKEDIGYYIKANKKVRYTHGLTEHVWDQVCSSLINFCPPPPDHDFPGDSPQSPGSVKGQISVKLEWPGHLLGFEGLVGWGVKEDEAVNASVSVLCGEHTFYAMARKAEDGLFPPQPNLMTYLGILKGNKQYFCPMMGNNNVVTLGGSNKLVHHVVMYQDIETHIVLRHTEVLDDAQMAEVSSSLHVEYDAAKAKLEPVLKSFMGLYAKARVEMLALQILQAMLRRRLQRFKWTCMFVTKKKIGQPGAGLDSINVLNFMSRPERRTMSIHFLQAGGTTTLASPLPDHRVRDFETPPAYAGPESPVVAGRLQAQQEREDRERQRTTVTAAITTERLVPTAPTAGDGKGAFRRATSGRDATGATRRKRDKDKNIDILFQ